MDSEESKKNEEQFSGDSANNYQDYTSEYRSLNSNDDTVKSESKSNSTISLIMGILSLVFCCCSVIGIIPGIVGIIFASKARRDGETSGMATGGLVCSIIGIVFGVIVTVFYAMYGYAIWAVYMDMYNSGMMDAIGDMNSSEYQEFLQEYIQNYYQ